MNPGNRADAGSRRARAGVLVLLLGALLVPGPASAQQCSSNDGQTLQSIDGLEGARHGSSETAALSPPSGGSTPQDGGDDDDGSGSRPEYYLSFSEFMRIDSMFNRMHFSIERERSELENIDFWENYYKSFRTLLDPIDPATGDKSHVQVDYASSGLGALRLARVYHSRTAAFPARITIPMGAGWRNHYDRSVEVVTGTRVRLHRASGDVLTLDAVGGSWVSSRPVGVLTAVADGWQYVNHRNVIENYDSTGRLTALSRHGAITTLQYDGSGRLWRAVDPFGRTLTFAYDGSGRINLATLPDGSSIGYGYDAWNNLVSTRFQDSSVRQYLYENASFRNALTGIVDEAGRRIATWGYDVAGQANMGYYGNGVDRVDVVYTANGATSTDAFGVRRTRVYGTIAGRRVLQSIQTEASGARPATTWNFSYDSNGNPLRTITRTGEIRDHLFDTRGRPVSSTRATGSSAAQSAQTSWHTAFQTPSRRSAGGTVIDYGVNVHGEVTQATQSGGGLARVLASRAYGAHGLLSSETDARGRHVTYQYDTQGNRTHAHVWNGPGASNLNHTTAWGNFNAHGQAQTVYRPDGTTESITYDARGRVTRVVQSYAGGSRTTLHEYDATGLLVRSTQPDGGWVSLTYDGAAQLASLGNHRGEQIVIKRDAKGQETQRAVYASPGVLKQLARQQVDDVGRVKTVTDSRNFSTQMAYRPDGRIQSVVDPTGRQATVGLDLLDRVTGITQPNTSAMRNAGGPATTTASTAYQSGTNLTASVIDTTTVPTYYDVDALKRPVGERNADGGNLVLTPNTAGDIIARRDARNVTIQRGIDVHGRLTSLVPSVGPATSFAYRSGRTDAALASMSDPSGSTAWSYNAAGLPSGKQQTVAGIPRSVGVAYDSLGRVSRLTYPSGNQVDIGYSNGTISALTINGATLLDSLSYRPFSQAPTGWRWGNGSWHTRQFDNDGRITSVTLANKTRSYSHDAAGRISGFTDAGPAGTFVSSFGYDEAGHVSSYAGPHGSQQFGWDTNGNRRSEVVGGISRTYAYSAGTNRLQSVTGKRNYSYNADGTPATDGANYWIYSYDAYGRLVQAAKGDRRVSLAYNGLGQRVYKQVEYFVPDNGGVEPWSSPTTLQVQTSTTRATAKVIPGTLAPQPAVPSTDGSGGKAGKGQDKAAPTVQSQNGTWNTTNLYHYVYDDAGQLLGQYDQLTSYAQETVWLHGMPVAVVYGTQVYHVHPDHLATPRAITRPSDNAVMWRWDSDPFGTTQPTGAAAGSQPVLRYDQRFPGQLYERETGLHYNGMRDYDPATGRYLQPDPLGLYGGLSRFAYVFGDPLSYSDPDGLRPMPKWWTDGWAPKTPPGHCATAECAGGLRPAPSENRTQPQIDYGQCKLVCNIAAAPAIAACNAALSGGIPGGVVGSAGRSSVCSLVCKP
jgi:RHS repeat-associated protein